MIRLFILFIFNLIICCRPHQQSGHLFNEALQQKEKLNYELKKKFEQIRVLYNRKGLEQCLFVGLGGASCALTAAIISPVAKSIMDSEVMSDAERFQQVQWQFPEPIHSRPKSCNTILQSGHIVSMYDCIHTKIQHIGGKLDNPEENSRIYIEEGRGHEQAYINEGVIAKRLMPLKHCLKTIKGGWVGPLTDQAIFQCNDPIFEKYRSGE